MFAFLRSPSSPAFLGLLIFRYSVPGKSKNDRILSFSWLPASGTKSSLRLPAASFADFFFYPISNGLRSQ